MDAREEMEVTADFEMKVDLDLQEPEPVSEETLDRHSDAVMDALEGSAADLALGHVISLDIPNSTISILFDVLGDSDAEIYEKLAEIIRIILRETGLRLRVAKVEIRPITEKDWEELTEYLAAARSAPA